MELFAGIDRPLALAEVAESVEVVGWAFARSTAIAGVEVWLAGHALGGLKLGIARPDVARVHATKGAGARVGFAGAVSLHECPVGEHELELRITTDAGSEMRLTRSVVVAESNYAVWRKHNDPDEATLREMTTPTASLALIVAAVRDDVVDAVRETLASIDAKTCRVLIVAARDHEHTLTPIAQSHGASLAVVGNDSTRANANRHALRGVEARWVGFIVPGDRLAPHALSMMAKAATEHPAASMIYSDEDRVDETGCRVSPFFKADFCPDSLLSQAYTGQLAFYQRELVDLRVEYEDSALYDLVLRLSESGAGIVHVPMVLFHARSERSRRRDAEVVQSALARREEGGRIVASSHAWLVRYALRERPRISIIIPTRDRSDLLQRCLSTIFARTRYPHFEVLVIDNGSTEKETLRCLSEWRVAQPQKLSVLRLDVPFNFSLLNNLGVAQSSGDVLLFLNNDTEVVTDDWLEAMLEQAQRPSIGAVGAKLIYADQTIQHAGVVLGTRHNVARHLQRGVVMDAPIGRLQTVTNYSAVTGACLMVRRAEFLAVGGFDESFLVEYNDIDLCCKLSARGLHNVYLPHVVLVHHDGQTRSRSTAMESRYGDERKRFAARWPGLMAHDPACSPHADLSHDWVF